MVGGRSCSVIGCMFRSTPENKIHFYQYPSDPTIREVWSTFTRRGSDYVVKGSSYICQHHFHPSSFVVKKKQVCLAKNTVPTIFHRLTPEGGTERIELKFDRAVMHYIDEEIYLTPLYDKEKREIELMDKKRQKIEEVEKLCRFCLEDNNEELLIDITKLNDYNIKPHEVMELFGLKNSEIFGKGACEECFQQIFVFDGYRKRCKKAQDRIFATIQEIDKEIAQITGHTADSSWMKTENPSFWGDNEEQFNNSYEDYGDRDIKMPQQDSGFMHVVVKQEKEDEPMSDDEYGGGFQNYVEPELMGSDDENEEVQDLSHASNHFEDFGITIKQEQDVDLKIKIKKEKPEKPKEDPYKNEPKIIVGKEEAAVALKNLTEYKEKDNDSGILEVADLVKQVGKCTIYECFFCRVRFTGKKLYKAHDCPVKEIMCEIPTCNKKFTTITGFNTHLKRIHRLRVFKKLYCRYCKLSKVTTQEEFNEHLKKCEATAIKALDNPVTCELCEKVCPNPKAFAIHMMFHKTGRRSFNEEASMHPNRMNKGIFICETCGKEFSTQRYLTDHTSRVHRVVADHERVFCDMCGKSYASVYAVRKHMRCVHLVQRTPCDVCGKVFRNMTLLKAHNKLLHDKSKRIHMCPLCPDRAPYGTKVALQRHQNSVHGFGKAYECDMCNTAYRTKAGLRTHKKTSHGKAPQQQPQEQVHQPPSESVLIALLNQPSTSSFPQ